MITWILVNGIQLLSIGFFALGFVNLIPSLKNSSLVHKTEPYTEPLLKAVRSYMPEGSFDFSYWVVSGVLMLLSFVVSFAFGILF
ncbi:MAG: YggT family protein [Fibrobacterales bacterium]